MTMTNFEKIISEDETVPEVAREFFAAHKDEVLEWAGAVAGEQTVHELCLLVEAGKFQVA